MDEVTRMAELARALRISDLPSDSLGQQVENVARVKFALEKALASEGAVFEASALDTSQAVNNVVSDLSREIMGVVAAWRNEQPIPDDHFLDVLEAVSPKQAERARKAVARFSGLEGEPSSGEQIAEIAQSAAELREAYTDLTSGLPSAVQEFLTTVPGGVSLNEIPSEVLDWITQHEAGGSFRVILRRTL
jgi:hypothetical protein